MTGNGIRTWAYSGKQVYRLFRATFSDKDPESFARLFVAPDLEVAMRMAQETAWNHKERLLGVEERGAIESVCFEITKQLADRDQLAALK